jgi:hypothetical protein
MLAIGMGLFVGADVSEVTLLVDDYQFMDEVAQRGVGLPYQRGRRVWPWAPNAGLVYIPGEGAHATD